jgi:tetratricopeptide (TPR) repeat protein
MRQIIYLTLLLLFLASCQHSSQKLQLVEEIIDSQPDSALKILKEIDYKNEKSQSEKAHYGILMFKALDKNYLTLDPDSLINFSITFYQNKKDNEKLGEALFYKGRMYNDAYQYENATKLYMLALDNLEGSENYDLLAKVYSDLGRISVIQNEFEKALGKFHKAVFYASKTNNNKNVLKEKINIANVYRFEKKFDKAHQIYNEVFSNSTDSIISGLVLQEIGVAFFWENVYDSTIYYLKKSLDYPFVDINKSVRLYVLADAYYELLKLDSALFYAHESLTYPATFHTKRECYRILANSCYLKKDFKTMAGYMTHYQTMSDSIRKIDIQTKATIIEDIHQSNTKVKEKSGQIYWLIALIILIMGAGIYILYRFIRKNRIISEQKRTMENSLKNSKSEIEQNKTMLRESMKDLIEKNKALKSNGKKNAHVLLNDETVLEIYTQALQINNYEAFSQKINAAYNNMICELAIKFPAISQKEMLYCSFLLLDIPQNHAMVLLETTPNGLYKIRQRLAQKLELSSTRELDDFLKSTYGK